MRRRLPFVIVLLCSCGGDGDEGRVTVPGGIGTEFLLFGTAPAGRGMSASSAQVVRSAELESVAPEPIAGGDVDMLLAGLEAADFPIDLAPDALRFVSDSDERARPLPKLHAPHVFEEPTPYDHPSLLVPVDQPDVPAEFLADREDRLERMLSGFAVETPCREPVTEISLFTPRIPAEAIIAMRTLSSGETFVGFSATSTAIIGVLGPTDTDPEIIGVTTSTSSPVLMGGVADTSDFGDGEVTSGGRVLPDALTVNVSGGFGSVGGVAFWKSDRRRWVDDTPSQGEAFPRFLYGVRRLDVGGVASVCTFGSIQGSDRSAGIWCRPEAGGSWTLTGRFSKQFGVRGMREDAAGNLLAFDLAGSVYEHVGDDDWSLTFTSSLNAGCDPLCANFGALAFGDGDLFGVVAGSKAQVLFIEPGGSSVVASAPDVVYQGLFADERPDAQTPIHFTAATIDPDGAIWLGTEATPDLFRVSPDRTKVERICIPKELQGMSIASLEAHPNGRLIIGMAPAIFAFTDWRL
jgi:hypothetical protein